MEAITEIMGGAEQLVMVAGFVIAVLVAAAGYLKKMFPGSHAAEEEYRRAVLSAIADGQRISQDHLDTLSRVEAVLERIERGQERGTDVINRFIDEVRRQPRF